MKAIFNRILCVIFLITSNYLSTQMTQVPSSFTDEQNYRLFCGNAAQEKKIFENFRNHAIYQDVVETVSYEQGEQYLNLIQRQAPHFLNIMNTFKTSDSIGNPVQYFYPNLGTLSPTTLRYIKVASDLENLLGSLDNMSIVEIGGGYGGLCKIIADLFAFKKYTIIDLEEPLALTEQFLSNFNIKNVELLTPESYPLNQKFDLVISNYAFSECTSEVQKQYINDIMKHSKNGYLICNVLPNERITIPSKQEVLRSINQVGIPCIKLPEEPLTNYYNYVIVWKNNLQTPN